MWHYYTALSGSNDVALGFSLSHDTVVRWNVTTPGKSFEMSGNRWGRIGWYSIIDGPITGDPTLPDGRYIGKINWMEHPMGEGSLEGVLLDGGIDEVHVELFTGVVVDFAVFE
jgi:hypothetical protein